MKLVNDTVHKIPSALGPRMIAPSSLRPGDWLSVLGYTQTIEYKVMVVQNSSLLKKVELLWPSGKMDVANYEDLYLCGSDVQYLGHGDRRRWLKYFPKFIAKHINPYSKP